MPLNWELHRGVMQELYIKQGCTLEQLRKIMSDKHRVNASSRTFKLKLDQWGIRKNKRRGKGSPGTEFSSNTSLKSTNVSSDIISAANCSNAFATNELHCSGRVTSVLEPVASVNPFETYKLASLGEAIPLSTLPSSNFSVEPPSALPEIVSHDTEDLGPIVNSSLMFFSSRPDSKSLQLLAKFPGMAPRAIEILLRNWKPGGEYMRHARRFLDNKAYCQALMSVNWTRWTHYDETLFDLLDFYVLPSDPENYTVLTKALLKADLSFNNEKLEALSAPWAPAWRLALRGTEWKEVKAHLFGLEVHDVLFHCAIEVVAEELLKNNKRELVNWKGDSDPFPEKARRQYMEILKDCRELHVNVDGSFHLSMRILWV